MEEGEGAVPPTLTGHRQGDGLAGLVVPVLVIHSLHVVTPRVRGHRGQDDQGVLQRDGSGGQEAGGTLTPHPAASPAWGHPHGTPSPTPGWGDQALHPSVQAEPTGWCRFLGFLLSFFHFFT